MAAFDDEIRAFYERYPEAERLDTDFRLEAARTRELIERFLPPAPATVLDVGGGPGGYAVWLAEQGYDVHLVDPVPLHVEQATAAASTATRAVTRAGSRPRISTCPSSSGARPPRPASTTSRCPHLMAVGRA